MYNKQEKNTDSIFGTRALIEAIKAGTEIDKVMVKTGSSNELIGELLGLLKSNNIPFQYVPIEKLNKISRKNHQGVIAFISPISFYDIQNLVPQIFESGKTPFLLILDKITDVRNFGAICRTANCAGVDAVIIPARGAAQINSDAVKTSAGALLSLPICKSFNLKDTISYLHECGIKILGVTEKAEDLYYKQKFDMPLCLIMGAEDTGISPEYLKLTDSVMKIPMQGTIESLNVSVAAGVVMYEIVKQRNSDL